MEEEYPVWVLHRRAWLVALSGCGLATAPTALVYAHRTRNPALLFFSGRIEDYCAESITLSRTLASREPVVRTFSINGETSVRGDLRRGVRASVNYVVTDGSYIARRILVRG